MRGGRVAQQSMGLRVGFASFCSIWVGESTGWAGLGEAVLYCRVMVGSGGIVA